ncbi:MAG TPA: hypothetical protein PLB54_02840 [Nitrosomonas sp.]|nr:hypothetical protein [Nitrosomonas sp.]
MSYIYGTNDDNFWLRDDSRSDAMYGLNGNDFIWRDGVVDNALDDDASSDTISDATVDDNIISAADWSRSNSGDEFCEENDNDFLVSADNLDTIYD